MGTAVAVVGGRESARAADPIAVGGDLDIVFAIDGSGSIDATDFNTEKRAIASALRDPALFPVNGTTSIGVVQWAGGQTRTEFVRTKLADTADVAAAAAAVEDMQQLGGGTNTGEGIQAAAGLLQGGTAARQTICVTTDGSNNTGIDPASAASAAKAEGVDRIAFATLEDESAFTEADARDAYGTVALDADVVHSRSPAEFSAVLPTACLRPALSVVAMEVTQGVQDWSNSVPLVARRPTFVRAFAEPTPGGPAFAAGLRLRGFRGDQELPGSPLVALNDGGAVDLSPNVGGRRDDPSASLNFRLPHEWIDGSTTLRLDAAGAVPDCHGRCEAAAVYRSTSIPEVHFVNVPYRSGFSIRKASQSELDEQAGQVLSALPIPELTYRTAELLVPGLIKPGGIDTIARMNAYKTLDGCWGNCDRMYYGVVSGTGDLYGLALGSSTAMGFIGDGDPYDRNTAPHEIGHLLGRPHAVTSGGDVSCSSADDTSPETYPFFANVGGSERAVLGPLGSPDTEVWGIDIRAFPAGHEKLAVIDPREDFELMSYCEGSEQGTWPSSHTWKKLIDRLGGSGGGASGGAKTDTPVLVVQGQVDLKTGAVTLEPNAVVTSEYAPATPAGDWTLVLKTGTGDVISSTPFAVDPIEAKQPPGSSTPLPQIGSFAVPVPYTATVASLEIVRNGSVVAQRSASAHAPTISITAPTQAATLSGDTDVTWNAQDTDGDQLRYTVQYSADAGQTWTTLSAFQTDSHLVVPEGVIGGSDQGAFRVLASDGFTSVSDTVTFLHVPNVPPRITITSPQDDAVFSGAQPVTLTAVAQDQEDGAIPDERLTWNSDLDGAIGQGASLAVPASQLTEGKHVITATAIDSAGATRTASLDITVQRIAAPANELPSIGTLTLSPSTPTAGQAATLTIDFADTDSDAHTVTVDWGDGTPDTSVSVPVGGTTAKAAHTWAIANNYTVKVRVSDGTATADDTLSVTVAPTGSLCLGRTPTIVAPGGQPTVPSVIRGTAGNDVILGSARADRIDGGGGDDLICGGGGADVIRAGAGADTVSGGAGRDDVEGGSGADTIRGGSDADRLWGGDGIDVINGEAGSDFVDGGSGADTIRGSDDADRLRGGDGDDVINGEAGRDDVEGGSGADTLRGGTAVDRLWGGDGDDVINGEAGRDSVEGGSGADTIRGGRDADRLRGGDGDDVINGEAGSDSVDGGSGADTLRGGDDADRLWGGAGADTLNGGRGPDYLAGERGNDQLFGEEGADQLYGGEDDDRLVGGADLDTLNGGPGQDIEVQ